MGANYGLILYVNCWNKISNFACLSNFIKSNLRMPKAERRLGPAKVENLRLRRLEEGQSVGMAKTPAISRNGLRRTSLQLGTDFSETCGLEKNFLTQDQSGLKGKTVLGLDLPESASPSAVNRRCLGRNFSQYI